RDRLDARREAAPLDRDRGGARGDRRNRSDPRGPDHRVPRHPRPPPVDRGADRGRRNRREAPGNAARRAAAVTGPTPAGGSAARSFDIAARPFHLAVGGLAAGLASSVGSPLVTVGVGAVLAAGVLLFARREGVPGASARPVVARGAAAVAGLAAALVLVGGALGQARLAALDAPSARIREARVEGLRAHLVSPPRPGPVGASAAGGGRAGP